MSPNLELLRAELSLIVSHHTSLTATIDASTTSDDDDVMEWAFAERGDIVEDATKEIDAVCARHIDLARLDDRESSDDPTDDRMWAVVESSPKQQVILSRWQTKHEAERAREITRLREEAIATINDYPYRPELSIRRAVVCRDLDGYSWVEWGSP